MKYDEIISEVKDLFPSEYDESQLLKWIGELEGDVALYRGEEPPKAVSPSGSSFAGAPFDRMYIDFVMAQICLHQHDDEGYLRYINMFNARYAAWKGHFVATHEGDRYQNKNWI